MTKTSQTVNEKENKGGEKMFLKSFINPTSKQEPATAEERQSIGAFFNSFRNAGKISGTEDIKKLEETINTTAKRLANEKYGKIEEIANKVAEAVATVIDNNPDVNGIIDVNNEPVPANNGLIIPITFQGGIDEQGNVIGKEPQQIPQVSDPSNPYIGVMQAMQQSKYVDNSAIINKYPQLKSHEDLIRKLGLDCVISQNPFGLILVTVFDGNRINYNISYTIDLEGFVLGPEFKWLNTYIPENNLYENYCCIPFDNLELLEKYLKNSADIEELRNTTIYNEKYLKVNSVIDLRTLPNQLENNSKEKIIDRLDKAIDSGVFESTSNEIGKYVFANFVNITSFDLIKGKTVISFTKDQASVNVLQ